MLNSLPTGKQHILLIAHNSDYDCRFLLPILQHVQRIVKSNRFSFQINATYYNPVLEKSIQICIKYSYGLIPMALLKPGECFNIDCHKEVIPYNIYIYIYIYTYIYI